MVSSSEFDACGVTTCVVLCTTEPRHSAPPALHLHLHLHVPPVAPTPPDDLSRVLVLPSESVESGVGWDGEHAGPSRRLPGPILLSDCDGAPDTHLGSPSSSSSEHSSPGQSGKTRRTSLASLASLAFEVSFGKASVTRPWAPRPHNPRPAATTTTTVTTAVATATPDPRR